MAVALTDLEAGHSPGKGVLCRDFIPAGHKVALLDIPENAPIRKYGQIIGFAKTNIRGGDHVHGHNVAMTAYPKDYAMATESTPTDLLPETRQGAFQGIVRQDGRIATRNYIGVLATVNCSASVARFIADEAAKNLLFHYPHCDGIVALGHGTGCCLIPGGEGYSLLQRALAGYARHPNFAGVVLVGLGCEVNRLDCLLDEMNLRHLPYIYPVDIQKAGGTKKAVQLGVEATEEILKRLEMRDREPVSIANLVLGLECGGSDAYSGISANPALGAAADLVVKNGGTVILSETPEIYGAEHLLTRRAATREVGEKLIERIRWWERYTRENGGEINNNPSPGNKEGGITNIWEKSLGAAAKGGKTNLQAVYGYAEPVQTKGLVFMDTPGYDVVSVTGMVAGGANVVCFTTGRGTVFGCKPVPVIKISSNNSLYERMKGDIDINCGFIITGEKTVAEMGEIIFQRIIATASGQSTLSEELGMGDFEFVPWQIGAVT